MAIFDELVESVRTTLSNDQQLKDIQFVHAHRVKRKPSPLKKVYVTLGIDGVQIENSAFANYLGNENGKEIFGRCAHVSIQCRIYSPQNLGGLPCSDAFSRISSALLFRQSELRVDSVSCKDVKYNTSAGDFLLECVIKLFILLGEQEDETLVRDIVVEANF